MLIKEQKEEISLGVFINSLLAFLTSFLLLKGIIAFTRYLVIQHYSGVHTKLNYEMICTSNSFSGVWTYSSVYAIYGIGVVTSFAIFILAEYLFKVTFQFLGVVKMVVIWLTILSLQHSFGFVFKGAVLKQDFYWVLCWMSFPDFLTYIVGVLSFIAFVLLLYVRFGRFLLVADSRNSISRLKRKRNFFIINYVVVSGVGYFLLFALNKFKIQQYELMESGTLFFALLLCAFRERDHKVSILKGETTYKVSWLLVALLTIFILIYKYL